MSMPLPSERPSFSAPQSSVIGRSHCWSSQHCSPHHRGSSMSLPLPSERLSSLSLRGMSSSPLQGIERSSKIHAMVSAHARLWALSKIHSVVSPHIESSVFFLKSCKGKVTRAASGHFLSWLSPGLCLGPHSFCPNILGPKKKKKKGCTLPRGLLRQFPQ